MKKLLLVLFIAFALTGCMEESTRHQEERYQEDLMQKASDEVGMPNITEFTEKKTAKMIWEMRDDANLITHSYIVNLEGKFIYIGQSIGYGLPYSTQYTNPDEYIGQGGSISQADPNGLYSGDGLSSTWVMLTDEVTGEISPIYVEQELFVSPNKLPKRLCDEGSLPLDY